MQYGIWEYASFLDGIHDLIATQEVGSAKILVEDAGLLGKK